MSILPPWTATGALDAADVADAAAAEREGWDALRSLQGDLEIDVLRYVVTPGDPARGVPPTRDQVAGLSGLPVLRGDSAKAEREAWGATLRDGLCKFELYTDVEVLPSDALRYPAGTGETFVVLEALYEAHIGRCVVLARRARGQGD